MNQAVSSCYDLAAGTDSAPAPRLQPGTRLRAYEVNQSVIERLTTVARGAQLDWRACARVPDFSRPAMRSFPTAIKIFVLLATIAACSGDSSGPGPQLPASATRLEAVSAVAEGEAGSVIGPFIVRALSASNQPVTQATLQWRIASGDASFDQSDAVTAADGRASARVKLGSNPGPVTISAALTGVANTPVQFAITNLPFISEALRTLCNGGNRAVLLLVEKDLLRDLRAPLDRFGDDLCAAGYTALEKAATFTTPAEVRSFLGSVQSQSTPALNGAILIGNLPHAYQYVTLNSSNPNIPPTNEEVISFQYYADLDGFFTKSAGYVSPGARQYSYDSHTGKVDWEIWIGALPTYKGRRTETIDALKRYFDKNHAYRTGGAKPPRRFLEVSEHFTATTQAEHNTIMDGLRTGAYAWLPFSNTADALLYFQSTTGGLTVDQGYSALTQGLADFTVTDAHGFWGASGKLTIAQVESTAVKTIFYWSNGCAVGDLDRAENFLTSILYSTTSAVLVAKGTTNNSGGMGNNQNGSFGRNIAKAMSQGQTFGDATLYHVNVPLISPWSLSREFHFGTAVTLGDPTLKLR
jgi:hypothetical protein